MFRYHFETACHAWNRVLKELFYETYSVNSLHKWAYKIFSLYILETKIKCFVLSKPPSYTCTYSRIFGKLFVFRFFNKRHLSMNLVTLLRWNTTHNHRITPVQVARLYYRKLIDERDDIKRLVCTTKLTTLITFW
jgi:hypothetical protein